MFKKVLPALAGIVLLVACGGERGDRSGVPGVSNLTVAAGNGVVILEWEFDGDAEAGFDIYRQTNESSLEPIRTVDGQVRSYTDADVRAGDTYSYAVVLAGEEPPTEPATPSVSPADPDGPREPEDPVDPGNPDDPGDGASTYRLAIHRDGSGSGIVTSEPRGIDCDREGENCTHNFVAGERVVLTATPSSTSVFAGWSGCDREIEGNERPRCEVLMDQSRTVVVRFGELRHELSVQRSGSGEGRVVSTPSGIDCGDDCAAHYPDGTRVALSARPADGSSFTGWSGCDESQGATCYVDLRSDHRVTATFDEEVDLDLVRLSVSKEGRGDGVVSSEPAGIDCGSSCSADFERDTEVTLTAEPDERSRFRGFQGCRRTGDYSCTVTLEESATITARFAEARGRVSAEIEGSGTIVSEPSGIDCPGNCEQEYEEDSQVALIAIPSSGYLFDGWSGDCDAVSGNRCSLTVSGEHSVNASFVELSHRLTVELTGNGSGRVTASPGEIDCPGGSCGQEYPEGERVTLTAEASGDSTFDGFLTGCDETGGDTCTVSISRDVTVVAAFSVPDEPKRHRLTLSRSGPEGRGTVTSHPAGIDCGEDCSSTFDEGTVVTLTATPSDDGRFTGWGGDCEDAGRDEACELTMTSDKRVSFRFLPARSAASGNFTCDGVFSLAVSGNVLVLSGAECELIDSVVDGNVQADGAGNITIADSVVHGNIQVVASGEVAVAGNDVDGNIQLYGNDVVDVRDNVVDGNLQCGDNGRVTGGDNLVDGDKEGQCSGL